MNRDQNKKCNGFSFPEIILVLGVISLAILLIFNVVRPNIQFQKTRNIKRNSDVVEILDAIDAYKAGNLGRIPEEITEELKMIGSDNTECIIQCENEVTTNCIDLSKYVVPTYIKGIPQDPLIGTKGKTYYAVRITTKGRFEVRSCSPEQEQSILVTR